MGIVGNVLLMSCSILITVANNFIFLIFKSYPIALQCIAETKKKNKKNTKKLHFLFQLV